MIPIEAYERLLVANKQSADENEAMIEFLASITILDANNTLAKQEFRNRRNQLEVTRKLISFLERKIESYEKNGGKNT